MPVIKTPHIWEAKVAPGHLTVETAYHPAVPARLKALGFRWFPNTQDWQWFGELPDQAAKRAAVEAVLHKFFALAPPPESAEPSPAAILARRETIIAECFARAGQRQVRDTADLIEWMRPKMDRAFGDPAALLDILDQQVRVLLLIESGAAAADTELRRALDSTGWYRANGRPGIAEIGAYMNRTLRRLGGPAFRAQATIIGGPGPLVPSFASYRRMGADDND